MAADERVAVVVVEDAHTRPVEVVELESFAHDADKLLSRDELDRMRGDLAVLRQLGDVIKDSGGLRKFRWGAKGKGKRGGARVVYYYGGDHMPIYLVAIYAKNEKADMTIAEKRAARKFIDTISKEFAARRPAQPKLRVVKSSK